MGPRRRVLKNAAAEADQFRRRAALAMAGVVLALGGLALWYFRLQVWQHEDYASRAEANRVKLQPVVPGRGLVLDREGRILADNVPAFRLDVTPDQAGPAETWLPRLQRVVDLAPEDIESYHEHRRVTRGFKPITLKLRVNDEEAARFAVDRWRFPGVELVPYLNRRYPYTDLMAHVVGYVGRVDAEDLKSLGEANAALTHIGKTGLERAYEDALRGRIGYRKIETNVDGRAMGEVGRVPAVPGADLRLSIDARLQRAMVHAFGTLEGSAVAVDPRTGEVLGMVSLPSFDPNLFVNGISHTDYRALMDNPSRPLFNRNVLGGGPPGSTIKPLVALAGVDSGQLTPESTVFSTGEFRIPGQARGYRDASGGAGLTDLRSSISRSVNYYYYKLAYEMGIERFADYMQRYGFGETTGIDLVGENDGVVPSPDYKRSRTTEPWYPGETVIAGIGQGYWIATALQLVRATAAVADGGRLRELRLVSERRDGYGRPWTPLSRPEPELITTNAKHLRAVQEGMEATIHGRGTATAMAIGAPYRMAGKTGTAQKISRKGSASMDPKSLPYHLRHQALFVGYAPADNPTIAVAVVVEHGGYGGTTAAPIARKIFDAWLLGVMPEPPEPSEPSESEERGAGVVAASASSPSPPGRGVGERVRRSEEANSLAMHVQRLRTDGQPTGATEPSSAPGSSPGQALRARTSATSVSPTLRAADAVQIGSPADLSPNGRMEQQEQPRQQQQQPAAATEPTP